MANRKVLIFLIAGIFASILCFGCGSSRSNYVKVVGSTSIQPFAELLADEYSRTHQDARLVEVQGGGSTAGIQAAGNKLADIGMCSRLLSSEETLQFTATVIARDGLAIVVNPENPISNLSVDQLRGLFSGRIRNWNQVGGMNCQVWPITREEGSGTRDAFAKLVMGHEHISFSALTQESNGAVKELVKGDRGAIGYMSLGLVNKELKSLLIDSVEATVLNIQTGSYQLNRPFLFVVKGDPNPETRKFIDFVLSDAGQKILTSEGLVSAK
ncbi:MAG: phosphate ABC transporter substrate-binding protein [Candidatus Wallbacteria bacterium]|nr:phosphate ABC transporter substrate-binding protein [Candidatus Wallbacteria bacterium]